MEIKTGKLYTFKMNSGEEIVGKITKINDDHYEVDSPLGLGQTQQGPGLVPSTFSGEMDGVVNMYKHSIALITPTREDVCDAYRESTTGIKVPDKKILMS